MNPLFRIDFSISDSLKIVRKSVLIYETIIWHLMMIAVMDLISISEHTYSLVHTTSASVPMLTHLQAVTLLHIARDK